MHEIRITRDLHLPIWALGYKGNREVVRLEGSGRRFIPNAADFFATIDKRWRDPIHTYRPRDRIAVRITRSVFDAIILYHEAKAQGGTTFAGLTLNQFVRKTVPPHLRKVNGKSNRQVP